MKAKTVILLVALEVLFPGACAYASELKPGEQVIFFPSLARQVQDHWQLHIHGSVFQQGNHTHLPNLMGRLLGLDLKELTADEDRIFHERCEFFLQDNERGRTFTIFVAGQSFKVGPSSPNGQFSSIIQISPKLLQEIKTNPTSSNGVAGFEMLAHGRRGTAPYSAIHIVDETGLSVVSDIDDTIKISQVRDTKQLLRNTFCRPFRPVPGMAELYQHWHKQAGAQFHYLSAMPWQLYLPMREFMLSNGFPAGTWECRSFRVKDASVASLFRSPVKYKRAAIERLLRDFPKRHFVLVGDSGEDDPEIYGAIARQFPQRITHIFIRDVTGQPADSPRYHKAFMGLDSEIWQVFKQPSEIKPF